MKSFSCMSEKIANYVEEEFRPEDDILLSIRSLCEEKGLPPIQVGPADGRHLQVLAAMTQARRAVEIGTLGGYSGVCLLRGMGAAGHLHSFELDTHHADVARLSFEMANLSSQVEVHVGPALDNLENIRNQAPFDLVFIDADKANYPNYLEWSANHLRLGGVVIGDNTFAFGHIHKNHNDIEDKSLKKSVKALHEFNRELARSERFISTILPTGEGLTIGVKVR